MFVFIKMKKVCVLCVVLLLVMLVFAGKKEIVPASAIPLSNPSYVIVIDAGHGEPDGGAVSENGIKESDINLLVAKDLEKELDELGYSVIMTRIDEKNIADIDKQDTIRKIKVSDINNRIKIVNESKADMCISIHMNKFASSKYFGWQTFYNDESEYGKELAINVQSGISKKINRENKREALSIKKIKLVDEAKIPTIIVECGFLSNPEELSLLQTEEYRKLIAKGIVEGIEMYYQKMYK